MLPLIGGAMSSIVGGGAMSSIAGGGASLAASQFAMQQMDQASAASTLMNSQAQSQKLQSDTANSIADGYVDSATKANNAATQSGKAINY